MILRSLPPPPLITKERKKGEEEELDHSSPYPHLNE